MILIFLSCSVSPPAEQRLAPLETEEEMLTQIHTLRFEENHKELRRVGKRYLDSFGDTPGSVEVRLLLGHADIELGFYDEAAEILTPLLDETVSDQARGEALILIADVHKAKGRFGESAAALCDALSADLEKARFSKGKGRFKEALRIINEVIDKDPKYPDALFLKARILWDGFGKREEAELESSIHEEAEQYIPFDINDVSLDFEILKGEEDEEEAEEEEEEKESDLMDVMLVAAKKDIVEDYVNLLNLTKLNPVVLDVDAFALQNAFEIGSGTEKGCYAIVNVGAEELGINAIKDGVSIFTRDSSYGGFQINEAIMEKFDVPYEEAENIKLGGAKKEADTKALIEILTSVVTGWGSEIGRALDFLATTYPDETIEKIIISGGSSRIPGFREYLEQETEIMVEMLDPFANLQFNEKIFDNEYLSYMGPQAAVAVGLALRSIGDK